MKEAKKIGSGGGRGDNSPDKTGRMVWLNFIMLAIKNQNVHENQHVNSHSSDELLQDVATLAALDAYSDLMMVLDTNISR